VAFIGDEIASCAPAQFKPGARAMASNRTRLPTQSDAEHAEEIRKLIEESREVLKPPSPDTFLGRKTQDPFPKEEAK